MSNLVICNHCENTFKEEDTDFGEIKGFWTNDQKVHLCQECKNKLDEWLNPESAKRLKEYLKGDKKQ